MTVTKTTAENASVEEAKAELDAFCQAQDSLWNLSAQEESGYRSIHCIEQTLRGSGMAACARFVET
ncbi:hypothetical protein [Neisseria yangbaofengii]|uniref:hypothetical protein n=1 Tax=Neisseria yangbaofengii TaxID=2709396 RepID=UPI001981DB99|nr:hypothetical protein [Neisseria yangbaofengii]